MSFMYTPTATNGDITFGSLGSNFVKNNEVLIAPTLYNHHVCHAPAQVMTIGQNTHFAFKPILRDGARCDVHFALKVAGTNSIIEFLIW